MKRTLSTLAATALAVGLVAAAPTADSNEVTVDGDSVTVAGTLADALDTVVIGTDPADDATGSGLGVDVSEYAVSFPEAGTLALHVTLGDANPATGYFPQGAALEVAPVIDGELVELTVNATADGGLRFGAQECAVNPDTGVNECTVTPVEGSYADGVMTWLLPTSATPGGGINGQYVHSNYYAGTAATGGVTFVNGLLDDMGISGFAALPSATLLVDGEAVGTAALSDAGYSVSAAGLTAGEHQLAVQLCSGEADFDGTQTACTDVDLGTVTIDG